MSFLKFEKPLLEGIISARPNRFIMEVNIEGKTHLAHCPVTGKIFNIDFSKSLIPCLVSQHRNGKGKPKRKTDFTIEAISIDPIEEITKKYIGINQIRSNYYIEHFIRSNAFPFLNLPKEIEREVMLGNSRFDFRLGKTLLEVKTPLTISQFKAPPANHILFLTEKNITKRKSTISNVRLIKHFSDIANYLRGPDQVESLLFMVFLYDALPFTVPESPDPDIIKAATLASELGLKTYQINLKIEHSGVSVIDHFPLHL